MFVIILYQLYMEITIQSIKVVESNNFLMYMMHDAVIESSVQACGLVPLYMFSCTQFLFYGTCEQAVQVCREILFSHAC